MSARKRPARKASIKVENTKTTPKRRRQRRSKPDKAWDAATLAGLGVGTEAYVRGADKRTKELFHLACIL